MTLGVPRSVTSLPPSPLCLYPRSLTATWRDSCCVRLCTLGLYPAKTDVPWGQGLADVLFDAGTQQMLSKNQGEEVDRWVMT